MNKSCLVEKHIPIGKKIIIGEGKPKKIMNKHFIPTVAKRLETKNKVKGHEVEVDSSWLDQFIGRINFWSFSFVKVRPNTYSKNFRVYTRNYILPKKVYESIETIFPYGCFITFCWGYGWRHTFDIETTDPIRWDAFIWRIVNALEAYI